MCFRADSDSLTFPHSGHLSGPGLRNGPGVIGLLARAQGKLTVNSSVIHQIEMGQIDKWEDGFKPLWCHRHINFPVWLTGVECPGCQQLHTELTKFEINWALRNILSFYNPGCGFVVLATVYII